MLGWNGFVGLLGFSLSTLANFYGGNLGLAIITLSIAVRLALLPLALRMARHARTQQKALREIRAEVDKLKKNISRAHNNWGWRSPGSTKTMA